MMMQNVCALRQSVRLNVSSYGIYLCIYLFVFINNVINCIYLKILSQSSKFGKTGKTMYFYLQTVLS